MWVYVCVGPWQCTVMLSPHAVKHDSDVCGLEKRGNQVPGVKVASGLTHLFKETETPGCTGESVWPHPTSGRNASIMRSVQIRGRWGEQEKIPVCSSWWMSRRKATNPKKSPLHVCSYAVLIEGFVVTQVVLCKLCMLFHGMCVGVCECVRMRVLTK